MPASLSLPEHIDLNLLRTLIAVVDERSTVAAARRLHLAQPTVSGALRQLRNLFNDELLVRQGNILEPTALALEIVRQAKPHLEALASAVGAAIPFDPKTDARTFRLGCTDAVAFALLPDLSASLRAQSPSSSLVVRVGDYRLLPSMLASSEVQTAVGYFRDPPAANAMTRVLRHAEWTVVRDRASPPVDTLDAFCSRPHALVSPLGDLKGFVDDELAKIGRSRHVAVGVSAFALLLAVIPGSDLISTVPDFLADKLVAIGDLDADLSPVSVPPIVNSMVWRATAHRDPAEQWFREMVISIFQATKNS